MPKICREKGKVVSRGSISPCEQRDEVKFEKEGGE